ncbi:tetratricopeptide repeat protein [Treponema sp. OMZ 840]|uniref:tetratricopeptide repeat protein n=1 Tax=Treponema sp. OMZ 840 TaxID=244313 RepID=UPI003D911CDF
MNKKITALCIFLYAFSIFCFTQENTVPSGNTQQAQSPAPVQEAAPPVQSAPKQKPDALKLYSAGRYAEAIAVCEQEISEKPTNIESYVVLCWSLVRNRQYSEAEYWALQGRKISRYDQRLVEVLGEAKYFLGQNREALALFQEYVSLVGEKGSRLGEAYYFMGEIYIRLARYNHADIAFSQAVRTEPLYDYWWTRLGYAREMAGNFSLSLIAYEKALELNAGQADALRGRDRVRSRLQ